jgi:transposase InsO family protein
MPGLATLDMDNYIASFLPLISTVANLTTMLVLLVAWANMFSRRSLILQMFPIQLLHCDVWTPSVISNSGFKFYLVILDDFSNFTWTFPLSQKSDVFTTLITFHAFVQTQFQHPIMCIQTNNGKEVHNHATHSFLLSHGIVSHVTCPYTSQQNGRTEQVLRTLNGIAPPLRLCFSLMLHL